VTLRDTPWVDTSFAKLWERIEAASPRPEWMPIRRPGKRVTMKEYGCGYYGCVMPTSDPTVVCKLTTDVTEAVFVAAVLSFPQKSPVYDGLVRYYAVYELPHDVVSSIVPADRNPEGRAFVLWREAVDEVGLGREREVVNNHLYNYKKSARSMLMSLDALKHIDGGGFDKILKFMELPDSVLEGELKAAKPEGTPEEQARFWTLRYIWFVRSIPPTLVSIGGGRPILSGLKKTLTYLYSKGLVLEDLHAGNFGYVKRPGGVGAELVITDPGHALPFHKKWTKIKVPVLP